MDRPEKIVITSTRVSFLTEGKSYEVHGWDSWGNPQVEDDQGDVLYVNESGWKPVPSDIVEAPLDFIPQLKNILKNLLDEIEEHGDSTDVVGVTVDSKPVFKDQKPTNALRKTITVEVIQYVEG